MRSFDYGKYSVWDNEILSFLTQIHEYKAKQELYSKQKPAELSRHVVAASIAKVDYFITVDDRLLRRYSTENLELRFNFKMLKPDDFLLELQKWN